jgi:hypothetical protein
MSGLLVSLESASDPVHLAVGSVVVTSDRFSTALQSNLSYHSAFLACWFHAVFTASSSFEKIFLSLQTGFEFDLRASIPKIANRRVNAVAQSDFNSVGSKPTLRASNAS